ncbi:MAG TPA: pilin [Candidatus Bipolaricaulota bacterium]|nr:pilin [Candidatus Bipolaricaulota bacterium]
MRTKISLKKFVPALLALATIALLVTPAVVLADSTGAAGTPDIIGTLGTTGDQFGAESRSLPVVIGDIIRIVLTFMGIILLVVILYGGFLYMTAGGADEKVKKAKDWIINGIIGLVIVLLAYAISSYVVGELVNVTLGA